MYETHETGYSDWQISGENTWNLCVAKKVQLAGSLTSCLATQLTAQW